MDKDFLTAYRQNISLCLKNDFKDNWDQRRFGAEKQIAPTAVKQQIKQPIKKLLAQIGLYGPVETSVSMLMSNVEQFQWVYQRLVDDESRQLLVQVLSFRELGHRHVKLPMNNAHYWEAVENAERLALNSESIDLGWQGRRAYRMDLSSIGYRIKLFYVPFAIIYVFVLHQYECGVSDQMVKAKEGNVVIDAGGCYGDTALYFAHEVGETGKVYSFEFLPENLAVFGQNMALNPELSQRIHLVKMPLWSKSGEQVFVEKYGPGTRVSPNASRPDATRLETIAIDDMVRKQKLDRVDFIKMDIEGAELESLRGAENTIRQFRPKLAISVYHKLNDLWEIPQYIDSLGLGYRFALRHFTIHAEETLLFAY
ncbi:MAG: FkbM family methyltransferase [Pyrinomonadaceae bacterium]|nr:FkbM family methyltransferase [Pyrinomonadaceae bacterium]